MTEGGFLRHDALAVAAFLDAIGIRRAHILGHSDGGSIALLLALERPDLARSIVAVAAHTHAEEKTREGLRHSWERMCTEPGWRAQVSPVHRCRGPRLVQAWLEHWLNPDLISLDIRAEIGRIRCPTLVIQGADDEFATPAHAEGIARAIPRAERWLIPQCGHNPFAQHPETINQRVLGFLRTIA